MYNFTGNRLHDKKIRLTVKLKEHFLRLYLSKQRQPNFKYTDTLSKDKNTMPIF